MKKVSIIAIAVLVLITASVFLINNDESTNDNSETAAQNTNDTQPLSADEEAVEAAAEQSTATPKGSYVDYQSGQDLASTENTKRVVFFHAEWCPTCKFYEKQIEEQAIPDGITIIKADFDKEKELKELLGVTTQSTFVLINREGDVGRIWPFAQGLSGIQDLYDQIAQS